MSQISLLYNGPSTAETTIALAHGAGIPMDSPFMNSFAVGWAAHGYRVARFEFPYMATRRETGQQRPPDREPKLRDTWTSVIESLGNENLIIGGKSMGGRIASLLADAHPLRGLICLGYPFHPVGRPDQLRIEHLQTIQTPTLILQGERDPFGNREQVVAYELSPAVRVGWLADGDHGFVPRKASGRSTLQNWDEAIEIAREFMEQL